jgi:hypothetical protein
MDSESRWPQLPPAVGTRRRASLAVWITAAGTALSSVTVALSALNTISTQQAIAMALPAVLITVGGMASWIVPDAWIAWRRGFRHGCKAGLNSRAYALLAENVSNEPRVIQDANEMTTSAPPYCIVCGRAYG